MAEMSFKCSWRRHHESSASVVLDTTVIWHYASFKVLIALSHSFKLQTPITCRLSQYSICHEQKIVSNGCMYENSSSSTRDTISFVVYFKGDNYRFRLKKLTVKLSFDIKKLHLLYVKLIILLSLWEIGINNRM